MSTLQVRWARRFQRFERNGSVTLPASSAPDVEVAPRPTHRAGRNARMFGFIMLALAAMPGTHAATINFTRHLDIYYGTWTVFPQGNPNPVGTQTLVEFTDHVSEGLESYLEIVAPDGRVIAAAPGWVTPLQTNVEWVLATPENLPAIANFNASVAGLGGTVTTDSGFQLVVTQTGLLTTFCSDLFDRCPAVGDTSNFNAEVSFFERNGSVTLPAAPVPEPGSGALLGIAAAAFAMRRLARKGT